MESPNYKNVHYGEIVEVATLIDGKGNYSFNSGYHSGMKIHYFNKKGVLLGNLYEFVSYDRIRFRSESPIWCREYMCKSNGKPTSALYEWIFQSLYELKCKIVTFLMRNTYHD